MTGFFLERVQQRCRGAGVVVAVGPLVPGMRTAHRLLGWGAERVFVLAETRGAGTFEEDERIASVVLDLEAPNLMASIRVYEDALRELPEKVLAQIAAWLGERTRFSMVAPFSRLRDVAGAPVLGARSDAWADLEDKIVIDAVWDDAGLGRAPNAIVPARRSALEDAARRLDAGHGTCWVGDNREGFHGGATYLRWIHDGLEDRAAAVDEAVGFFATHCDQVRVMPYLTGTPCSIHGIVLPRDVIALRPVEMTVFERPGQSRLLYAGINTYWDPDDAHRDAMRTIARRAGAHLRERVGYRGGFTVDGVLSDDGRFLPTELNARLGAGIGPMAAACGDEFPVHMLEHLVRDGDDLDGRGGELEALVLERADATRGGGGWTRVDAKITESQEERLQISANAIEALPDDTREEEADGTLSLGGHSTGGMIMFRANPRRTQAGPSLRPLVKRVFAYADARHGAGIGAIEIGTMARV